ncbi:NAD(P)H-hydrate epimerase [Neisseria iguanae]|uniref:NAD(P)H-hydrate epimerase n=1 Tax=Neisseria iguanae TaxID=90242 RepID=A0A2P7TZL3_9NEIS|nr:NAD(P)H-hydrate epimerase [Neisseria iguanae]PSJ80159.1 NAD(P)H-hydrate epimerase [Neisseria iguanae]
MKIYNAEQMRAAEQAAADKGTSFEQLMENAGQAAAADILRRCINPQNALVVCGKGNNGGDALVIARVLQQHGWQVDIALVCGNHLSGLAELNRKRLNGLSHITFLDGGDLLDRLKKENVYGVVIDGIFGTGFGGKLPGNIVTLCQALNDSDSLKIALDIPTGLNGDTAECDEHAFRADTTYAFGACKPAHMGESADAVCGEVVCLDIGID